MNNILSFSTEFFENGDDVGIHDLRLLEVITFDTINEPMNCGKQCADREDVRDVDSLCLLSS